MRAAIILLVTGAAAALAAACDPSSSAAADDGGPLDARAFGPRDPGFANMPAGAWTAGGGATIEDWVPPGFDQGVARFSQTQDGFVFQKFAMPAFSKTEPFALETIGTNEGVHADIDNMPLGILALTTTTSKSRLCLGERAFDHDVTLAFVGHGVCSSACTVDLDHVAIVPAPECPVAGVLKNGDFEVNEGWGNFIPTRSEIIPSGGTANTRAGHVATVGDGGWALTHDPVSVPWKTMDRPALRFVAKGSGEPLFVTTAPPLSLYDPYLLNLTVLGTAQPSVALVPVTVCLPEWTKGLVLPISFELHAGASGEYTIDDVGFVSELSCPVTSFIIDGDFESPSTAAAWFATRNGQAPSAARATIVSGSGARGGQGYATIETDRSCELTALNQTITVPPSVDDRGPAVKFWYRTSAGVRASFGGGVPAPNTNGVDNPLPASADWIQRVVCLNPSDTNRAARLSFYSAAREASGASDCSGAAFPAETLFIDDVEVTTDASCPAK